MLTYKERASKKKLAQGKAGNGATQAGNTTPQRCGIDGGMNGGGEEQDYPQVSEVELTAVADAGNVAVQKAVNLLESWTELKVLQAKSAIAHKAYDKKLRKLQEQFKKDMAQIDDKSAVLRESLKKINTAQTPEMLKEGLLSLSDGDKELFSEKDLDDFLSGKKTIEL